MRNFSLTIIVLFWYCASFAQYQNSHSDRLPWVDGKLPPVKGGYEYTVARGEGKTLAEARENAMNDLLTTLGNKAGVSIGSSTVSEIKDQMKFDGKRSEYSESSVNVTTIRIDRDGFKASVYKASEYFECDNGKYRIWELYETAANGANFKPFIPEYTESYGIDATWRSALVPGWGQFYKKKTGKGILFLTLETATISAAVYCETQRSDNMRKSEENTDLSVIKEYRNRADRWTLYRNVAIGTAAGAYLWNLLDATLAKGKIRYAWIPENINLKTSNFNNLAYYGITFNF